jgi:hypothetical protein
MYENHLIVDKYVIVFHQEFSLYSYFRNDLANVTTTKKKDLFFPLNNTTSSCYVNIFIR